MARQYQPYAPFNVPFKILSAQPTKVNGVNSMEYIEGFEVYYCSARAYVGSPKVVNDISAEEDTLVVDSYWIPDLKKNDRIRLLDDDSIWELYVSPENINRRNQYAKFKVFRVRG